MPIVVPPFVPYQAPLIPIRGLWNHPPPEGDRFIPVEIDWGITTGVGMAVQISISAFSPVEFSQVCAFNVDNGRNGSDTDFLFPDTGRQLTVPAYCQGLFPVISNAMTFYVVSANANVGDITVFEICNSIPPPISVLPSQEQTQAGVGGIDLGVNATTQIVPASVTGTIQALAISVHEFNSTGAPVIADVTLVDGTGRTLWVTVITIAPNAEQTVPISVPGLRLRFINGIRAIVSSSTIPAGETGMVINVFYSVP